MPKRSASLLFLALSVLGCRSAEVGSAVTDPVLTGFIPNDTVLLAAVHLGQIRTTPLYQKLKAGKSLPGFAQFTAETGFNPGEDVTEILIGSNGKDMILAARGRFNVSVPASLEKSTYKGYTVYGNKEGGFALLDSSTAVAGTNTRLQAALDQYKSGSRSAAVRALLVRARAIPGQNQLWAVSSGGGNFANLPQTGNAANLTRIMQVLEDTTFAADLRAGFHATAAGNCKTEQDAKTLGDSLRGLIGLGRLSVPENQPQLLRLYDGFQVDQQQRSVKVVAAIPPELVDKLLEMTGERPHLSRPAAPKPTRRPR